MSRLIITGHGEYATGIKSTLELICGSNPNVHYVNFNGEDDGKLLSTEFEKIAKESSEDVIFICDMAGATPFMKSVLLQKQFDNIYSIGGANVSAIVEAVNNIELSGEEIVDKLISSTKASVRTIRV